MEIKVNCACGSKYKFETEPVNGRMPAPLDCPVCGADGTAQANEIIQQASAPAPSAPPGGGIRLARSVTVSSPPPVYTPPPISGSGMNPLVGSKSRPAWQRALTTAFAVALIAFGTWAFVTKWSRRINLLSGVAHVLGDKSTEEMSDRERNIGYDDCSVLFIKASNHVDVASACQGYWKEQLHKNLTVSQSPEEAGRAGEYELIAAHNGYVRIVGAYEWPVTQVEGVAQYLSAKLNTTVFEWRSEHFADTYHFGVYDQGKRLFHAQMDVKLTKDDAQETVTVDGKEWAEARGYKGGAKGFKDFNVLDADQITHLMGMKLWDESDTAEPQGGFMKESGLDKN